MNFISQPYRNKKKLLIVFGTRPEALKCFPVARAALASPDLVTEICVTAQHREMVDSVINLTGMPVDYDLNAMQPGQTLFDVTAKVLTGMEKVPIGPGCISPLKSSKLFPRVHKNSK